MELQEFLEKYLSDYEVKREKYFLPFRKGDIMLSEATGRFYNDCFPEALQNFTNKISKKQRENCADVVAEFLPQQNKLTIKVSNAEQPKIDEV